MAGLAAEANRRMAEVTPGTAVRARALRRTGARRMPC